MSETLSRIKELVAREEVLISSHGYDELAADDILVQDLIDSIDEAILLEDYPDYPKGPCLLVLQHDSLDQPVHVVWGIPRNQSTPAVIVTAYRPDPRRWSSDFKRRIK